MSESQLKKKQILQFDNLIVQALFINIVLWIFMRLFYYQQYDVSDDFIMSTMIYGGYGYYDPYVIFENMFLTKVIVKFLTWFPGLPWYAIVQSATIFAGLTVITYLILGQNCKRLRRVIWLGCLVFVGYECYVQIQFTKTAAIASIAGILMVYRICKKETNHYIWAALFAVALCSLGILWRAESFLMVFLILFVIGLADLIRVGKKNVLKRFLTYVIAVCCLGVVYFGFNAYHKGFYTKDPEWKYYMQFNSMRAQLVDYEWPDYDENMELYNSLGMTEEDIEYYDRWNYGDPELFTIDALQKLTQVKNETDKQGVELLKNFLQTILPYLLQRNIFYAWLMILIASFCLQSRRNKLYSWFSIFLVLAMEFYFVYIGRGLYNRIDVCVFATNGVMLLMLPWQEENEKEFSKSLITLMIGVLVVKFPLQEKVDYKEIEQAKNEVELMNSDLQSIYYMEEYTLDDYEEATASVWDTPRIGLYSNISRLGGWKYPSPHALAVSQNYGIVNPYRQMIDNPNVYLVCKDEKKLKKIVKYIQRHYNKDAHAITAQKLDTATVYRIVTSDK